MAHKFAFVCGLHRSGTTILTDCLGQHPGVSNLSSFGVNPQTRDERKFVKHREGQFVQDVYRKDRELGVPVCVLASNPAVRLTEEDASDEKAKRLYRQWAQYWDVSKPVLAEKTPSNLYRTKFLQALFPTSLFVRIVRHPVAQVLSLNRWNECRRVSLRKRFINYFNSLRLFEDDAASLREVVRIRYEEFVKDPAAVVNDIAARCGLNTTVDLPALRQDTNVPHFRKWKSRDRSKLVKEFEESANRVGYSLMEL